MAVDKRFVIPKLQNSESLFVLFSRATKLPFVICDPDSFNDQIMIFTEEEQIQKKAKEYGAKEYALVSVKMENPQFLKFYLNLFHMGVNAILFMDGEEKTEILLTEIVRRPNEDELPDGKRPLDNPELQLTALYFLQELRRPGALQKRADGLKELDEELAVNLAKARFLTGVDMREAADEDGKVDAKKVKMPYIKNEKTGDMFQPIFTDGGEYLKYDKEKRLHPMIIKFADLERIVVKECKGVVLNPNSINLPISREQLQGIQKKHGVEEPTVVPQKTTE